MNIGGKKSTEQGSTTSATTISQVLPVDDFAQDFSENLKQAYSEQGAVTVCVFGKSGCGKSTLINTIFGEIVADTGYGRPVTQDSCLYVHESGNLRLIDSRGAEIGRDDQQLQSGLDALVADSKADGGQGRIHVAWYCVAWNHRRFEDSDVRLIERLRGHGIPVIVVMTKVPMIGDRIHKDAQTLAESILSRGVPVHMQRVFPTCALADPYRGQPQHGIAELLDATYEVVPDEVHAALTSAQQFDFDRKRSAARKVIATAAAAAGLAGAPPVPVVSMLFTVPAQIAMMAKIAQIYAIPFDRARGLAVVVPTLGAQLGRVGAASLLKLIPGAGPIVGGVIGAAVSAAVTGALGCAWAVVCERSAKGEFGPMDLVGNDMLGSLFLSEFKQALSRGTAISRTWNPKAA